MIFESALYILNARPLSGKCFTDSFSQYVSLEDQRFYILVMFSLLIFSFSYWVFGVTSKKALPNPRLLNSLNVYSVVQVFYIPTDLFVLSLIERRVLKSPTMLWFCLFFYCSSDSFCFMYFEHCLRYILRIFVVVVKSVHFYVMPFFILRNISCSIIYFI